MKPRNDQLDRLARDLKEMIEVECERCSAEDGPPFIDVDNCKDVVRRIGSFLSGRVRTLDAAFSSGRRGRRKGSGKLAQKAIDSERLLRAGASVRAAAKADGSERSEVRSRRERYRVEIMASDLVARLQDKDRAKPKRGG